MPSPTVLLFGGLALFLFGMQLAKDHMQRLAGERIRVLIQKLTDNPILGLLLGICMTITVQSSGATAVLLVGLGSSNLITTRQAMAVLLGAAIGTTLTVQLISFKIIELGLPIITFGLLATLLLRN